MHKKLNDRAVSHINANLTAQLDVTTAARLTENTGLAFQGTIKSGNFDLDPALANKMLRAPANPNGRPNRDVIHPWANASDIAGRGRKLWIIDFGSDMSHTDAALYELPFEYVQTHVRPTRAGLRRDGHRLKWWIHAEARPGMRLAIAQLSRFIVTPRHSKHRFFTWLEHGVLPDSALVVIARGDDYMFGALSNCVHEMWARSQGTQVREVESGFRYTPESTFDTFPFPWPPGKEPTESEEPRVKVIADAARELVRLRDAWLNPPGIPEADLKDRTLTKLYNKRPEWLANAHRTLDQAVFAAYGWSESPDALTDQEILARLLALNHERAAAQSKE